MERTLAIIKPDAVAARQAGQIIHLIEQHGFEILGMKMLRLSKAQAEEFYAVHRGKGFYGSLVAFMTEGPILVMALQAENAVTRWRDLMGATDPAKAAEGTIRKRFATNIERNCVHGSDAPETADRELRFFFSTAELI